MRGTSPRYGRCGAVGTELVCGSHWGLVRECLEVRRIALASAVGVVDERVLKLSGGVARTGAAQPSCSRRADLPRCSRLRWVQSCESGCGQTTTRSG
eukprot:scaffold85420_cov66-Phaeocystis_antarctica.AAC.2